MKSPLLILTVGTGTAGRYSSLADGLRSTITMLAPRLFWLVPSTSPDSQTIADLIREDFPNFYPWADRIPYHAISEPDSLLTCRRVVREVIARARQELRKGERLLVNPTSGTKQMSAGASIAALDESLGEIVFTVGERTDGVVKTGTERLEFFDASSFFAERDLGLARELFSAGASGAAYHVLARHESLVEPANVALCLHEWERLNYEGARKVAAASPALVASRHGLTTLADAARTAKPHPLIVADLFETARVFHDRSDYESSLSHTCKGLEMGLRLRLFQTSGLYEPYRLQEVCALPISDDFRARLRKNSSDGKACILGLRQVVEVLNSMGDPLAEAYRQDRALQRLVGVRNELIHAIRPVSAADADAFLARSRALLEGPLLLPPPVPRADLAFSEIVPVSAEIPT